MSMTSTDTGAILHDYGSASTADISLSDLAKLEEWAAVQATRSDADHRAAADFGSRSASAPQLTADQSQNLLAAADAAGSLESAVVHPDARCRRAGRHSADSDQRVCERRHVRRVWLTSSRLSG